MDSYLQTTVGRLRWWIARDLDPAIRSLLDPVLEDPDGALENAGSLARTRTGRKRFYHVRTARPEAEPSRCSVGAGLFVKVFGMPSGARGWLRSLGTSRALREARVAAEVQARGIPTAAPIAVGEERSLGRITRSFSVIPELPARDLRAILLDRDTTVRRRRELLLGFAAFLARLHGLGIDQDDTSPNNFLVSSQDDSFVLIDFERCRVGAALSPERRWRLLAKLERHDLGVPHTDRLRLLRTYLAQAGEPASVRQAWEEIAYALLDVRRNDARRARNGAFQEGRQLAREGAEWQVRGREGLASVHLELEPDEARRRWILAHQLERLKLPALRPVRLTPSGLQLMEPTLAARSEANLAHHQLPTDATEPSGATEAERSIQRARRRFEALGTWVGRPRWGHDAKGAWLENLESFALEVPTRPSVARTRRE